MPGVDFCRPLLPGIIQRYPSSCRDELLQPVWKKLITHLGVDGERILTALLLDCGIFVKLDRGSHNYRQLSGVPVYDLVPRQDRCLNGLSVDEKNVKGPSEIRLVRSRILYGKPIINQKGEIHWGLRRIHILNRLSNMRDAAEDVDLMKYIFPRQFRLHNVFTSTTDRRETTQTFKDYTVRDAELSGISSQPRTHVPRRLRGKARLLAHKLRQLHHRCSYEQLMYHFCPTPFSSTRASPLAVTKQPSLFEQRTLFHTQVSHSPLDSVITQHSTAQNGCADSSYLPYTTSPHQVSAFCRSVLFRIIPQDFFGSGSERSSNWKKVMGHVDRFVHMRKFETTSLHELCQGVKLGTIDWLSPTKLLKTGKLAISDTRKRQEILQELLYYLFDSILVPLISSNFYVTESGVHRNKLLYFRHDVWQRLCQPTLASSRLGALVPLTKPEVRLLTRSADPWYSVIRFLPKEIGTRPIANLRRRTASTVNGKNFLTQSINARLAPIFSIFNYEKEKDASVFRSEGLSLHDLGEKLSKFKTKAFQTTCPSFYFVKVDIQSAFDSIPQDRLLSVVNQIFKHENYYTVRHAEGRMHSSKQGTDQSKAVFRFVKSACPVAACMDHADLQDFVISNQKSVIFSGVDHRQVISADQAKSILRRHVQGNVIKMGRDMFKKSEGIAQGSVLSSLLCTFFYNDFEMNRLGFLRDGKSVLLRVIDDFLLITTEKADARRFMTAMRAGDASYGIRVQPEKSLVNFDMSIDGVQVPKLSESSSFPYCGLFIDTITLQISKNRSRKDNTIANSLTVDLHGRLGDKFRRRILSSLRIQLQAIIMDRALNDKRRLAQNLVESIQETTMKMHQYYAHIPVTKRPDQRLLVRLAQQLMGLGARIIGNNGQDDPLLTRPQVYCLSAAGMLRVLDTKKSQYPLVLSWLWNQKASTIHSLDATLGAVDHLVESSFRSVQHYSF